MYSSREVFENLVDISVKKTRLILLRTLVLGFLAGSYIGFGSYLYASVSTGSIEELGYGPSRFFGGLVFSVGLMLVVIAGGELFTGNMLAFVGYLSKKVRLSELLGNFVLVFLANFFGAIIVVLLVYFSGLNGEDGVLSAVGSTALEIAEAKVELSFVQAFLRGILANWLVCLAVVMALASKDLAGKVFACLFPVMAFVAMGFEHSIANMFFLPSGWMLAQSVESTITLLGIVSNLAAVTFGNMIGGLVFVALAYWTVYLRD